MFQLAKELYVTGHIHYQERLAEIHGTQEAMLVREPDNTYDTNAIMVVDANGSRIGYVPKWQAKDWAPRMDGANKPRLTCTIRVDKPSSVSETYRAYITEV